MLNAVVGNRVKPEQYYKAECQIDDLDNRSHSYVLAFFVGL